MTMIANGLDRVPPVLARNRWLRSRSTPFVRLAADGRDRDRSKTDDVIPTPRIARRLSQSALGCLAARSIHIVIARISPALPP